VFEQYAQAIQQKHPGLLVDGGNYPPPALRAYFAQFLSIFKFIFMISIIFGINPFTRMNIETPSIFTWAIENKIYAVMMLFFIGNLLEGQLISTGAFEILFNDVPVWSKLETGRVPSPQEMFQIVDNHMRLYSQES